jgi:hypothetical protein
VAASATGVFVATEGGAVVDPQPTKRNGEHTTKAIVMLATITRVGGEKRFLDMSFLLIRNSPMSRVIQVFFGACHVVRLSGWQNVLASR